MRLRTNSFSRGTTLAVICALLAVSGPLAEARPLTPDAVHARILKRGLGNWVGVELLNGTAFVGRIVNADDTSFSLQLHNDPAVTPILYSDVVRLHTGISHGAFLGIALGGFAASAAMAAIGFHELHKNEQTLTPPQPVFP